MTNTAAPTETTPMGRRLLRRLPLLALILAIVAVVLLAWGRSAGAPGGGITGSGSSI